MSELMLPPSSDNGNVEYDENVKQLGMAQALEELVNWVERAYAVMDAQPAGFLMSFLGGTKPRFLATGTPIHAELTSLSSFRAWIFVASHQTDISRFFGESEIPEDYPFAALSFETVRFLNDLRRRYETFDASAIREEALAFLKELAVDRQKHWATRGLILCSC